MVKSFLPTSKKEMERLGWDSADVILFSGDAYVDHPSFGVAVIARVLEAEGYRVAVVPQPDWHGDLRDFKKLGRPNIMFGIAPGAMDSMVNRYTANRRLRHDDAYTPDGRAGARPEYPTIVYARILKELYPDIPVVLGGIEASLRRLTHYDYWQDRLRPPLLVDSPADLLIYGMGERTTKAVAAALKEGKKIGELTDLPQTVVRVPVGKGSPKPDDIILHSYEECLAHKRLHAENFRHIEEESNAMHGRVLWQKAGEIYLKVNPMLEPMSTEELDAVYRLPFTRVPHPRYKGKCIPAYEMIRHSVCMHRGCFGGCAFCTISAHQGKFISSRSQESIIEEVKQVARMDDFRGYVSDLGGPSANMYAMRGKNLAACAVCRKPSCLHPQVCPNMNTDHSPLIKVYAAAEKVPGVKKCLVGSGVRYDLSMADAHDAKVNRANADYLRVLIERHVGGRLKVAPEHTSSKVLNLMRKPEFSLFKRFKQVFDNVNRRAGLNQQIIPYFISSHPGCREEDMVELACETKQLNFRLEQVQDFTPTPMTLATTIYYTGIHPYTGESVYTARTPQQKLAQRKYFFWYDAKYREDIRRSLMRMHRPDLLNRLFTGTSHNQHQHKR